MCQAKTTSITRSLDTLELTAENGSTSRKNKGLSNGEKLFSARQKSKAISQSMNGKMCYLNSEIHKDYQAAYYCNTHLFQYGKKVTAKYCRKRNCLICARVKAAQLMRAYAEPLLQLPDLHLVTLTKPNVKAHELSAELGAMYSTFRAIKEKLRKRKIRILGFRKLEITYNHRTDEFNPHYHILVSGKELANLIRFEWLQSNEGANYQGQDVRKVYNKKGNYKSGEVEQLPDKGALLEVFKYVTKTVVKDNFNPYAMDEMYRAIKGVRTIQPMGIKKVHATELQEYQATEITHRSERVDVWKWCNKRKDWYTVEGERFNTTFISQETKRIVNVIEKTPINERNKAHLDFATTTAGQEYQARKIFEQARSRGNTIDYFDT